MAVTNCDLSVIGVKAFQTFVAYDFLFQNLRMNNKYKINAKSPKYRKKCVNVVDTVDTVMNTHAQDAFHNLPPRLKPGRDKHWKASKIQKTRPLPQRLSPALESVLMEN